MAKTGNAVNQNSAGDSTATARPAGSQPAKGKQAADTGTEVDYDLPNAAEVAAFLPKEPAAAADDDGERNEDEGTDEEPTAQAAEAADDTAADDAGEGETDEPEAEGAETETDESDNDAESGDEAAAETGDETEEPSDEEDSGDRKRGLDAKIGRLTRRAKEAEEEAARLREQLATTTFTAPDFGPLANVDALPDLQKAERNELALHKWALENEHNPEGADLPDGKGGTRHFEPEQIRRIKANTFEALYSHIPARREYLSRKAQAENEATQAYPWLRQVTTGDGAEVQRMIEARPYLRQAHDYRTLAADAHVGAKLRKAGVVLDEKTIAALAKGRGAKTAPAKTPGTTAKAPAPVVRRTAPSPGRPGVLPPRQTGREAMARAAQKRLTSSDGSLDDIANSIAARWR